VGAGGAARNERIRRLDVGIPRAVEIELDVEVVDVSREKDVSGEIVLEWSRERVGRVVAECEEWWSDAGLEGTKRSL
jgi:hypothetical protein